jgi:hypothetical protein
MAENKTKPTAASVERYLAAIADEARRADCESLAALMARVTKEKPVMWGTAIVGFGTVKYKYASGREGETCRIGFSSRKGDISVYGLANAASDAKLCDGLGKYRMGKGCLYIARMSDIDARVLERLVSAAVHA